MKRLYFIVGIFLLASRAEAFVNISPSTATVFIGGQIQFSSTDTVTWSTAAGSLGSINSGGLYTAPTTYFTAKNVIDGCMALPNDHIYNTRINNLPVHANNTTRVNNMVASRIGFEVDFPHNVYNNHTPTTSMVFRFTASNNGPFPMFSWPYRGEEASNLSNDPFAQDHHILGVSSDTCNLSEIYQFYATGADGGAPTTNSQSGIIYDGTRYALPDVSSNGGGATDAAGMFIQPLALRYSELNAGVINHALRISLNNGNLFSGFLWPATASTNQCGTSSLCFPYGSRIRLKASYSIPGNASQATRGVMTALKNYGAFFVDGGTAMRIQTMADATLSTTSWNALQNEMVNVSTMSQKDFEQVDESTLMVSTASGRVNLSNAFIAPDNYAEIIAKKTSDSSTTTLRVAIQPVTIGALNIPYQANSGSLSVMAGTPQFPIQYWVKGATNTSVNCTITPAVGTIANGCLYTPPATQLNTITVATFTITASSSDPNAFVSFPLTIFSSDAIRMREGAATSGADTIPPYDTIGNFTDTSGNVWFMDPIGNFPNFYSRDTQGSGSWPNQMYNNFDYGSGDKAWGMMVPNGNYLLTANFGTADPASITASTVSLDTQGVLFLTSASLVTALLTPHVVTSSVTVTNNQFYWAIRGIQENSHDFISYWSLVPSSVSAPVITSPLTAAGTVGVPFSYQITALNSPTSFNATPLPTGIGFNSVSGLISGTPTTVGVTNSDISATNANGTGHATLVITISPAPVVPPKEQLFGHMTISGMTLF